MLNRGGRLLILGARASCSHWRASARNDRDVAQGLGVHRPNRVPEPATRASKMLALPGTVARHTSSVMDRDPDSTVRLPPGRQRAWRPALLQNTVGHTREALAHARRRAVHWESAGQPGEGETHGTTRTHARLFRFRHFDADFPGDLAHLRHTRGAGLAEPSDQYLAHQQVDHYLSRHVGPEPEFRTGGRRPGRGGGGDFPPPLSVRAYRSRAASCRSMIPQGV